jgi:5-methylcytosine-specific restriction endonuclease McrA
MSERNRRWLLNPENREKARVAKRRWAANNRAQVNSHQAKRRYRLKEGGYTQSQWNDLLEQWNHRCAYCGADGKLEADHVAPLSRGGKHDIDNILPACQSCNRKKHNKYVIEWLSNERWS